MKNNIIKDFDTFKLEKVNEELDLFGTKKREEKKDKLKKDWIISQKNREQELISRQEDILNNQPPIIEEILSCIEQDDCIFNARPTKYNGNHEKTDAILSNNMRITIEYDTDDQDYDHYYYIKINNGNQIKLTSDQYKNIYSKIDNFLKNTWGEEEEEE
jgi:hypothetical protein